MDGDKALLGGALRPGADAADMPGVAERDDGEAGGLGFADTEVDGDGGDRLAEADVAIDDGVGG